MLDLEPVSFRRQLPTDRKRIQRSCDWKPQRTDGARLRTAGEPERVFITGLITIFILLPIRMIKWQ